MSSFQMSDQKLAQILTNNVKEDLFYLIEEELLKVAKPVIRKCAEELVRGVQGKVMAQTIYDMEGVTFLFQFNDEERIKI